MATPVYRATESKPSKIPAYNYAYDAALHRSADRRLIALVLLVAASLLGGIGAGAWLYLR